MNKYIELEAAITEMRKPRFTEAELRRRLANIPAADVRPVVHGHWISTKEAEEMGDIMKEFTCSICGCCEWDCTESESFNFCPNCGADMRGKSKYLLIKLFI